MRATRTFFLFLISTLFAGTLTAQAVLFDFDSAPLLASLPIDQTSGAITAHLSATGQGYSIQNAGALGFTPAGFSGRILYPNSINLSDLFVRFSQALTDFSIMYACQELGCDNAATMRVTAYLNGAYVGTNTRTATHPGTWPVDTLGCSFAQGFDSVVVHYASPPPTCQDYGTIFVADNMQVSPLGVSDVSEREFPGKFGLSQNFPNPFNPSTTISYTLAHGSHVHLAVLNLLGERVADLVDGEVGAGYHEVSFNAGNLASGVYLYRLTSGDYTESRRMVVLK